MTRFLRRRGFTLIELLIVILIIGILLAIAAPSFLGQQNKAKDSEAKQNLTVAYKDAKAAWVSGGQTFPADIVAQMQASEPQLNVVAGTGYTANQVAVERVSASQLKLRTLSGSGKNVALSVIPGTTNERVGAIGSATPTYTNLVKNPSFETGTTGWAVANGATIAPSTTQFVSGTNAAAVTAPTFSGQSGIGGLTEGSYTGALAANTTYTLTTYVYNPSSGGVPAGGGSGVFLSIQGAGVSGGNTSGLRMAVQNAWVQLTVTFTTTATPTPVYLYVLAQNTTAGQVFYVDAVQLTATSTALPYFDGDSPNASWTGTAHASTSTAWSGSAW